MAAAAAASSDGAAPAGNRGALLGSEGRLGLSVDRLAPPPPFSRTLSKTPIPGFHRSCLVSATLVLLRKAEEERLRSADRLSSRRLAHPSVLLPPVVGLTGGIASGKSTVSNLLASEHGLPVVDADVIARDILEPYVAGKGRPSHPAPSSRALWPFAWARVADPACLPARHSSGQWAYKAVVAHFGPSILLPDSDRIDRAELGRRVFGSPNDRRALNAITHPAVRREMLGQVARHWLRGASVCVCDVPLLIEAGLWRFAGEVVVVYVCVLWPAIPRPGLRHTSGLH
jgi:dephospho-CoA kinase